MPNLNQVNIIGHVTRAVEVRYTPKGKAVADIGVAINRQWTNEREQVQKETTFVEVTSWGRLAEICAEYLRKGDPVFFTGRLKQEQWVDQAQQKRSKLVVVAEAMQLLTKAADRPGESSKRPNGSVPKSVLEEFPNAREVDGPEPADPVDALFGGQKF